MLRVGIAGQMAPAFVCPNILARVDLGSKKACFVGEEVYKKRDADKVHGRDLKITTGDLYTWEHMEEVWKHTFKRLKVNPN